jgi:hypothetical protein
MPTPSLGFLKDLRSSNHEGDDLLNIGLICRTYGAGEDMPLDTRLVTAVPDRRARYWVAS